VKPHTYTFKAYNGRCRVYIDGHLFFAFTQLEFVGLYAYKDDTNLYGLDLYLKTTTMEIYFKTREAWIAVMDLLEKSL